MSTYYINADTGNDSSGSGTSGSPWATLAKAYAMASSLDTIIAQDATAHYLWTSLTIDKSLTIQGVTIGGAIFDGGLVVGNKWLLENCDLICTNLSFTRNNETSSQTAGFKGNSAAVGSFTFNNCIFYGNVTSTTLCGLFTTINSATGRPFTFNSCLWYGNTSTGSGSFFAGVADNWYLYFNNCIIHFDGSAGNTMGALIASYGGTNTRLYYVNCILLNTQATSVAVGGTSMNYSCYYGTFTSVPAGTGRINVDPRFIDSANRNYNLAPTSPCIGTGTML